MYPVWLVMILHSYIVLATAVMGFRVHDDNIERNLLKRGSLTCSNRALRLSSNQRVATSVVETKVNQIDSLGCGFSAFLSLSYARLAIALPVQCS